LQAENWKQLSTAVCGFLEVRRKTHAEDVISFVLFNHDARILPEQTIPLVDLTTIKLEGLLQANCSGGTNFGPALKNAYNVIYEGIAHAKVRECIEIG